MNDLYYLGLMYSKVRGVPQDYAGAEKWYRESAEQGLDCAMYELGLMYEEGIGVRQDYANAVKWYRKAVIDNGQTDASAMHRLGNTYIDGRGVPQNFVLGHMWFNLAAPKFRRSYKEDCNKAVRSRDLVATKVTPSQIEEAQRLARE